jgi:hypothetical protein
MCVRTSAPLHTLMRKRIQSSLPLGSSLIFLLTPTICDIQVCGTAPLTNSVLLIAGLVSVSKETGHPVHTNILFIPYAVCLMRGPRPLSSRVPRRVRSSMSSFNLQYPLFSLRSFSSLLHLLRRLPVTCILPSIFPSITCFKGQLLRKIWQIQTDFLIFIVRRIFLYSLILYNTSFLTRSFQMIFSSVSNTTLQTFPRIYDLLSELWSFSTIQDSAPNSTKIKLHFNDWRGR